MTTRILKIETIQDSEKELEEAADLLRNGSLVAIPTETVYGLAANALDPQAARAIYAAKGRPCDNPLIVHILEAREAIELTREIPEDFYRLAERFWPGPMTVILHKSEIVPPETSGGLDTVAIRIPAHPIAREIIRRAGVPLAAPSANLSGSPSPTCAQHCIDDLMGRVEAIVDGGQCGVGLESTVLTLCTSPPKVLRPGAVTLEMLREVLPEIQLDDGVFTHIPDNVNAASPGMKYKHYAPKTRVILVRGTTEQFVKFMENTDESYGVLCYEEESKFFKCPCITCGSLDDATSQARELFDSLRRVDGLGIKLIYAHVTNTGGIGQAVYNRLLRAAAFDELTL